MEFREIKKEQPLVNQEYKQGLLHIRTANACINEAKNLPIPKRLCGEFWFENEVSILFSDTNVGKSILAVQIANNISRGNNEGVFFSEASPKKVLYLDFELADKQFEGRYSQEWENHYIWDSNFFRVLINPQFTDFEDFEKQLFAEIEAIISKHEVYILIVDNITYLRMQSTESGKEALPLMKYLIKLKNQFGLSLLVLAHTPKRINPSNPLNINDLAGSKHLANFADSVFCLGRSEQSADLRYIKQLKARSCAVADTVMVCELNKPYNFLGFEFFKEDYEYNHLKPPKEADEELKKLITEMKAENPNVSLADIAEKAGTNKMKISRMIKRHDL